MPLEYYLIPNNMTSDPDDYYAISKSPQNYTIEDVYEQMTREGSTVTKAEALAGFEEVLRGIVSLVEQGHSVATPLVNIKPGISGVFEGDEDRFDKQRHQVNINVTPGIRLRDIVDDISTEKITQNRPRPTPLNYHDNGSETQNEVISPLDGARITGSLLKFDPDDTDQGLFFVNTNDASETRVDTPMLKNKPGELIFLTPDLTAGTYQLEVRSMIKGNTEIRTGALPFELTVS